MLPAQAADVIGWSRQGVIKAAEDGRITGVQVGRMASRSSDHVSEGRRSVWILEPGSVIDFAEHVAGRKVTRTPLSPEEATERGL